MNLSNSKIQDIRMYLKPIIKKEKRCKDVEARRFYEVMSISKSVVGLVFLDLNINLLQPLFKNIPDISLLDALCHFTGVNDSAFDFFEFMKKVIDGDKDIDNYAKIKFQSNIGTSDKKIFTYNNLAYRILTGILQQTYPGYLNKWTSKQLGQSEANWGVSEDQERKGCDVNNVPNGLNGLRLTMTAALKLVKCANTILRLKAPYESITVYSPILETSGDGWARGKLDAGFEIYCYCNWYMVVKNKKIIGAYGIGFSRQYMCLNFTTNQFAIQFRIPFWDESKDDEASAFGKNFFECPEVLNCNIYFDYATGTKVTRITKTGAISEL